MDRDNIKKSALTSVEGPALPQLPDGLESAFNRGHTLSIEGTNVIRVPFGTRRSRRNRPERPDHWATLVIPIQPVGDPTLHRQRPDLRPLRFLMLPAKGASPQGL